MVVDDGKQRIFVDMKINDVDKSNGYMCQIVKGTRITQCLCWDSVAKTPHKFFFEVYRAFVPTVLMNLGTNASI